jgi:hypothetical protein
MNDETRRIRRYHLWLIKVLLQNLSLGAEQIYQHIRIADISANARTGQFLNMNYRYVSHLGTGLSLPVVSRGRYELSLVNSALILFTHPVLYTSFQVHNEFVY